MSHSTIGTSSFLLSKYSRSYPVKRTLGQKAQIPSQAGPETTAEWQHFTNPIIRLILDVKSTADSEIESVKLRILWELNYGIENGANQQDVEDLELLSFSALASGAPRKNQSEGLPLKAVYRDTVVGIRYLHSREDGVPVPSHAAEFIEMIKPVCPCKLNPMVLPPLPVPSQIPALANRTTTQKNLTSVPSASTLPNRAPSFACPLPALPVAPQAQNVIRYTTPFLNQNQASTQTSSPLALHISSDRMLFQALDARSTDDQYPLQNTPMHDHIPTAINSSAPQQGIVTPGPQKPNTTKISTAFSLGHLPSSSLPSLPTPSSSNPAINGLLPAQINIAECRTGSQIFQTVCDQTSLYNMSNSALERFVGEIIHEEGFIQLASSV
ncbi:hypothetical protein JR316_0002400 [Psilocybe cubensis]|uniref:Uncharacterized protein n=1 Tax=Psilocybe cubensis TaxID=181762 RepID=A0ACB8HCQ5_PSICU|nr:hypothetical protein JR316_0002400 [Psilocybe cubensis]KAH9485492.1 hypothetical protein JR316_0002400 [Psilocybe cubensis]